MNGSFTRPSAMNLNVQPLNGDLLSGYAAESEINARIHSGSFSEIIAKTPISTLKRLNQL